MSESTTNRFCAECNDPLEPDAVPSKVYCCRTCLVRARNRRNRPMAKPLPVSVPVQPPRVARGPRLRAATLAATPDEPAANAARGDVLTGGAAATSYAQSVRLVGVGI